MESITELKEVILTAAKFGNAVGRSLKDGKIGIGDIAEFIPAVISLPAALEGISQIPAEVKDLTDEELNELTAFINDEFDIPQDGTEDMIEDHIALLRSVYVLVTKYYA